MRDLSILRRATRNGIAGFAVAFCFSGCAVGNFYVTDDSLARVPAPAPGESKVTIAVTPFVRAGNATIKSENILKFEQSFFPVNLVAVLKKFPCVENAYFSPAATPATDYRVGGKVILSDGENTEVQVDLFTADGVLIFTNTYGYANAAGDFRAEGYLERLWYRPANKIITAVLEDQKKIRAARVKAGKADQRGATAARAAVREEMMRKLRGYAGSAVAPELVDNKVIRILERASLLEREKLLAPLTISMQNTCDLIKPRYRDWQYTATVHAGAKRRNTNERTANMFLAVVTAVTSELAKNKGDGATAQRAEQQTQELVALADEKGRLVDFHSSVVKGNLDLFDTDIKSEEIVIDGERVSMRGTIRERQELYRQVVKKAIASGTNSAVRQGVASNAQRSPGVTRDQCLGLPGKWATQRFSVNGETVLQTLDCSRGRVTMTFVHESSSSQFVDTSYSWLVDDIICPNLQMGHDQSVNFWTVAIPAGGKGIERSNKQMGSSTVPFVKAAFPNGEVAQAFISALQSQ